MISIECAKPGVLNYRPVGYARFKEWNECTTGNVYIQREKAGLTYECCSESIRPFLIFWETKSRVVGDLWWGSVVDSNRHA